ncbi:hypothetical protein LINGRAHAP2_LOCUS5752, partial [Linum grandiflorum]
VIFPPPTNRLFDASSESSALLHLIPLLEEKTGFSNMVGLSCANPRPTMSKDIAMVLAQKLEELAGVVMLSQCLEVLFDVKDIERTL